jgi:6-pyruvoyltetrahydropterin/6-carboxytetrahydropterin synthase
MYTVAVARDFMAQHYLVGGEWGPENQKHTHHYRVELQLDGQKLDEHGYLVDIMEVETALNALAAHYRDQTLNELPEFAGLNPSLEHFARILCTALAAHIQAANIERLRVALWENEIAWASYAI